MNWKLKVRLSPETVPAHRSDIQDVTEYLGAIVKGLNDDYEVVEVEEGSYVIDLGLVGDMAVECLKDELHAELLRQFDPDSDSMIEVEINYD